jgi:hypothetical protein
MTQMELSLLPVEETALVPPMNLLSCLHFVRLSVSRTENTSSTRAIEEIQAPQGSSPDEPAPCFTAFAHNSSRLQRRFYFSRSIQ